MLAYILAIAVTLGSLSLYLAAFLLPEIHRKYDLAWSGVGLFYGLVLWVCAGRITGGVLLGQIASVSLIGWFGWQTLTLRLAETAQPETPLVNTQGLKLSQAVQTQAAQAQAAQAQAVQSAPPVTAQPPVQPPVSLVKTVQERIIQYRQGLRQNPETSSVLLNLDRLVENTIVALDRLRIWTSALMSTIITDAEPLSESQTPPSSPPISPSPIPPSPVSQSPHPPIPPSPPSPPPDPSHPEIAIVRIEVEPFSAETGAATPEPAAEWSDLEFDSDPEMETIEGSMESISEALKRSPGRSKDSQASDSPG